MDRRTFLEVGAIVVAATFGYLSLDNLSNVMRFLLNKFNIKETIESHPPIHSINASESPNNRVVVVHDSSATNWDFTTGWYGDYVDQKIVDKMIDNSPINS